jgi:hypothetical protein
MPVILDTQEVEIRRIVVQSQTGQIVHLTPSQKYPAQKGGGRVAQVEEHLPSRPVALSSNPNATKKKGSLHCSQVQRISWGIGEGIA